MNLKKKVVLITGTSSGIGREVALILADRKANLILTYNKNRRGGEEVFDECSKKTKCLLVKLDIQKKESINEALKKIRRHFGKIDILMNNAAVIYRKLFMEQTIDEIEQQVMINLLGGMRMTRLAIPYLKRKALILNMGSLKSRYPFKKVVSYCASKFGVRGFTQSLALELPKETQICLFNPNQTATRMGEFKGDNPKDVAGVIVKVMERKIKFKKGADIDARDYLRK